MRRGAYKLYNMCSIGFAVPGFRDYVTKYGDSAAAISDSLGDAVKMCPPGEKMNILDKQLVTQTPINDLPQARKDRDTCLAELAKLKRFSSKT